MAAEKVETSVSLINDNKTIAIKTTKGKFKENSIYEVTITGLTDDNGNELEPVKIEYRTPYSPLYCSLDSLKMVIDTFNIPEEAMVSYIRQASREADFISGGTADASDFAVQQFARTRATYDCLTRGFMDRTYSGGGSKYKLDTAEYEDSLNSAAFKQLLDRLGKELQKWQDAIRGYFNEGRAKPKATRVGIKSSQNSEIQWTTLDTIIQDVTRSTPQWS
jgi:hypothetical protein